MHNDIRPENFVVDASGKVLVIDLEDVSEANNPALVKKYRRMVASTLGQQ